MRVKEIAKSIWCNDELFNGLVVDQWVSRHINYINEILIMLNQMISKSFTSSVIPVGHF